MLYSNETRKKLKNYKTYKLNEIKIGNFENSFSEFLKLPFSLGEILKISDFSFYIFSVMLVIGDLFEAKEIFNIHIFY